MRTLAITLGDINGVGPEIALRAVNQRKLPAATRFVLIGSYAVTENYARRLKLPVPPPWHPGDPWPARRRAVVWQPPGTPTLTPAPGRVVVAASRAAVHWIEAAVRGCQDGTFDAMVTAPICKEGLKKAHIDMPGHTEFIARLTGTKRYAMMLMGDALRVVLVTRHLPLARVPEAVTPAAIRDAVTITAEALPWLGCRRRLIGVCALNPHAGDGGALGSQEKRIITPTLRRLQRAGIRLEGPIAADVIFHYALKGQYDAVVAMYHDQGLGPLKMISFDNGINITLGLPIIRTSPDHGTAFDIAGRLKARPDSMLAAIRLAARLAGKKNPWK